MSKKKTYVKSGLAKAISLFLIFAFSFISFVQLIHAHNNLEIEHVGDQQENNFFSEKCSICDYIAHKNGKDILLPLPFSISFVLPKINIQYTGVFVGNYKFTLQGFTNKGPPVSA